MIPLASTGDLAAAFVARSRHYLSAEYPAKLRKCLQALPDDAVWARSNDASNSVGNLLLHLAGNVRQWIITGVGGAPDTRHRASEFAARQGGSAPELFAALEATIAEADAILARLDPAMLMERRSIQGRDVSVFEAVFHVVEHFAMHTGQIILMTKARAPDAVRFYEDAGGLAKPLWNQ